MPRSAQTKSSLRKENEDKIRRFLTKRAGKRPKYPLCSRHGLRAKRLCTSVSDPALTNVGRWMVYCRLCDRSYFSAPVVDMANLLSCNEEFQTLIATRRSLQAGTSRPPNLESTGSSPSPYKVLVIWTQNDASPTQVTVYHHQGEPLRLKNHKLALGERGIEYNTQMEVYDFATNEWIATLWSSEIPTYEGRDEVLIRDCGVTPVGFERFLPLSF